MSVIAVLALGVSMAEAQFPFDPGDFTVGPLPDDGIGLNGSGAFACEFFRPDLAVGTTPDNVVATDVHVQVLGPPAAPQVLLTGLAVCGLSSVPRTAKNHLADFVWAQVNVLFSCPTVDFLNPDGVHITQSITDNCAVGSVTGTIIAQQNPPPFPLLNNQTVAALVPSSCSQLDGCGINVGFANLNLNTLQSVCPSGALSVVFNTDNRLVSVNACYCNNHFHYPATTDVPADNPIFCLKQQGKYDPQTAAASGAENCAFDYQKSGSGADTLNLTGISTIQFAISNTSTGTCPVNDLDLSKVTVCDGLKPKKIGLQTNAGVTFVNGQFSENACVKTLTNLQIGESRNIYFEGQFNDGTKARGFDTVTVVGQQNQNQ